MYAILETLIDALRLMTFQPLRHDIHRTRPERTASHGVPCAKD
ncbi:MULTISPECIES: hypothetical protein [Ensifer]|jgi:hypothetical protein|nr:MULTISPECIES: hypothetical protein [Ensifer]MDP9632275.1 hypothetical protein [Ensifer adhaerens]